MENILLLFCRRKRGWKQHQAARAAGITKERYAQLENGDEWMTDAEVYALAKAFNASPMLIRLSAKQIIRFDNTYIQLTRYKELYMELKASLHAPEDTTTTRRSNKATRPVISRRRKDLPVSYN